MDKQIVERPIIDPKDTQLMGTLDPTKAFEHQRMLEQFIAKNMKVDEDFGKIPGTPKRTLYQPGAQKLLFYHGLGVRFVNVKDESILDWDKGFWNYVYKCTVFHKATGIDIAECIGSANNKESRYAWVWVKEADLPRDFDPDGVISRANKWKPELLDFRLPNPEPFNLPNTLMKMAQKRALVGATITATRASAGFIPEDDAAQQAAAGGQFPAGSNKKAAASKASGGGSDCISPKQKNLIFAKLKGLGKSPEDLKAYFEKHDEKHVYDEDGTVHLSRIKRGDMNALVKYLEAAEAAQKDPDAGDAQE